MIKTLREKKKTEKVTMLIKIKYYGKRIQVDVSQKECVYYQCFSPHKYTHYGQTIDGKSNNNQDKGYSCSHRNYHGCPDNPKHRRTE